MTSLSKSPTCLFLFELISVYWLVSVCVCALDVYACIINVYICVYVCVCACVCLCLCLYIYVCVCVYVCMYVYMYVSVCMCVYVCMSLYVYVHVCPCVFKYMSVYVFVGAVLLLLYYWVLILPLLILPLNSYSNNTLSLLWLYKLFIIRTATYVNIGHLHSP